MFQVVQGGNSGRDHEKYVSIVAVQASEFMQIRLYILLEDLLVCKLSRTSSLCAVSVGVRFVGVCTRFHTLIIVHKVETVEL